MTNFASHVRGLAFAAMVGLIACSSDSDAPQDPAYARGQKVYQNICTTCHSADPSQDGVLGPPIAGASRELLEAKMVRGEYPPGYEPKRNTAQMPPLTYLEPHIDDLTAFLAIGSD